jgi:hypothetical protein
MALRYSAAGRAKILYQCVRCGAPSPWLPDSAAPGPCAVRVVGALQGAGAELPERLCGGQLERVAQLREEPSDERREVVEVAGD